MLAPWMKSYDQPRQHIKKQRHYLPAKVHLVKAMVFAIVMYDCESWTIKKAEHQRIDAFEMWCWRRLLRVPWTARRFNQSILNEISPEYSLEGLMLKQNSNTFATWHEELTYWKRPWCQKKLKVGGEGDDRGWDGWMASPTQWTWVWVNFGSWWRTGRPALLQSKGLYRVGHVWATELNWAEIHVYLWNSRIFDSEYQYLVWFFGEWSESQLVVSHSLWLHGILQARSWSG